MRCILVSLLGFFLFEGLLSADNIYLVSVGISDYPGIENDLILSANDARSVNSLYRKNGNSTTLLLTNQKATKDNIIAAMRQIFIKAENDDIIVFFFSGHGYSGGFMAYDTSLQYKEIREVFAESNARCRMIFADACFSGDMRENGHRLGSLAGQDNVMLFLSCRNNEYSFEFSGMKNGLFTSCLVRSLRGGADYNNDRTITAKELYESVSEGVTYLSSYMQHPVMWGKFNNDMPVIVW